MTKIHCPSASCKHNDVDNNECRANAIALNTDNNCMTYMRRQFWTGK